MNGKEPHREHRDADDLMPLWKSVMRKEKNLKQVMKALALHGPCNIWELSTQRDTHRGYTEFPWISVKRYLKDLAEIGFVQTVGRRKALRGRGKSKVYGLTVFGLFSEILDDKGAEAQREQTLNNYSKVLPKEKLDEMTQFHELVKEIEKEKPDFREMLFPNLYAYTHKILLKDWIENPIKAALRRIYESQLDWKDLGPLLSDKPLLIAYSLLIVKDFIDIREWQIDQAKNFMRILQDLAQGKIPEEPKPPVERESLAEEIMKTLQEPSRPAS